MNPQNKNSVHSSVTRGDVVTFFFVAVGTVAITYLALSFADLLPESPEEIIPEVQEVVDTDEQVPDTVPVDVDPLPTTIIFDSLEGREVRVLNPEESTVEALDAALLTGVVRHPDGADFKNEGTIFLLGHSSYLPVVNNKNFQAFNGIQKLSWGDTIRLRSRDTEYLYSVERVYETKASDAEVEIEWGTSTLVLATCNSFATKDDRFIVEAVLVGSKPLKQE